MTATLDFTAENFVEGDDLTIVLTFKTVGGALYDFTGITKAWFTLKSSYTQRDEEALIALNSADNPTQVTYGVAGPGAGKMQLVFTSTDTAGLANATGHYYDIQVTTGSAISTLVRGEMPFSSQVTRAKT